MTALPPGQETADVPRAVAATSDGRYRATHSSSWTGCGQNPGYDARHEPPLACGGKRAAFAGARVLGPACRLPQAPTSRVILMDMVILEAVKIQCCDDCGHVPTSCQHRQRPLVTCMMHPCLQRFDMTCDSPPQFSSDQESSRLLCGRGGLQCPPQQFELEYTQQLQFQPISNH